MEIFFVVLYLPFGSGSAIKLWEEKDDIINQSINELINYNGNFRAALGSSGSANNH